VLVIIAMGHCMFTGLPMLFIWSHTKIKDHSVKRMKQLIMYNKNNDVIDLCC
jgi:hypothetical protein